MVDEDFGLRVTELLVSGAAPAEPEAAPAEAAPAPAAPVPAPQPAV